MRIDLRNPLITSNSIPNRPKTPSKCDFYFAKYATMLFKNSLVFVCGEKGSQEEDGRRCSKREKTKAVVDKGRWKE
jgi:hypothetical protein